MDHGGHDRPLGGEDSDEEAEFRRQEDILEGEAELDVAMTFFHGEGTRTGGASAQATSDALVVKARGCPNVMFSIAFAVLDVMVQVARGFRQSRQFPSIAPDTATMSDYRSEPLSGGFGGTQWGHPQIFSGYVHDQ
ncbi:hypothetical protein PIB30_034418 [Stylosanthes scabra]|uniref:Uncharacterized protein n=1 Tax=Stylosanthes scabra TaxID=79078 RepID=A0ABU6QE44_9FABA|nr:hypothetical protein [Stylosanthes scabra]